MPETPIKSDSTPAVPVPTPDPEKERLAAEAADSARRANIAEQRAAYAAGMVAAAQKSAQPQVQHGPDSLDKYTKEDLTLSPEDKKALLDRAMRERADAAQRIADQRLEQRLAAERASMESKFALDMVTSQRPDILDPKNAPLFGAAVTKVQIEAQQAGQTLTPAQLAQKAALAYDQMRPKTSAPPPPFTEGARTDFSAGMTDEQREAFKRQPQSEIEKMYGQKPGTVRPPYNINDAAEMSAFNLEYVRGKNEPLFKKGVVSNMNEVLSTREQ